jgi:hypothetical protein
VPKLAFCAAADVAPAQPRVAVHVRRADAGLPYHHPQASDRSWLRHCDVAGESDGHEASTTKRD